MRRPLLLWEVVVVLDRFARRCWWCYRHLLWLRVGGASFFDGVDAVQTWKRGCCFGYRGGGEALQALPSVFEKARYHRKGDGQGNAVMEPFFGEVKRECPSWATIRAHETLLPAWHSDRTCWIHPFASGILMSEGDKNRIEVGDHPANTLRAGWYPLWCFRTSIAWQGMATDEWREVCGRVVMKKGKRSIAHWDFLDSHEPPCVATNLFCRCGKSKTDMLPKWPSVFHRDGRHNRATLYRWETSTHSAH